MKEKIYQWLLGMMSDKELCDAGQHVEIKIPGFRGLVYKNKLNVPRNLLISELLNKKNRASIDKYFNNLTLNNDENTKYRVTSKQNLLELAKGGKAIEIFRALISDSDIKSQQMAEYIFEELNNKNEIAEISRTLNAQRERSSLEKKHKEEIDVLKESYKNLDEKNMILKDENKELKNENKELKLEINKLQREKDDINEKYEKIVKKINGCENYEETLKTKDIIINDLKEKLKKSNLQKKEKINKCANENPNSKEVKKLKNITIFGRIPTEEFNKLLNYNYNLTIIDTKKIYDSEIINKIKTSHEIWLLSYQISLLDQFKIRELIDDTNKTKNFKSLTSLRHYVVEGVTFDE